MAYEPREGSAADKLIAYIKAKGATRTRMLSEGTGVPTQTVYSSLQPAVDAGLIVRCKVTGADGFEEQEYREGAGVPMASYGNFTINPAKRLVRPGTRDSSPTQPQEAPKSGLGKAPAPPPASEQPEISAPRVAPVSRRVPAGPLVTGEEGRKASGVPKAKKPAKPAKPVNTPRVEWVVPTDFYCGYTPGGHFFITGDICIIDGCVLLKSHQVEALQRHLYAVQRAL